MQTGSAWSPGGAGVSAGADNTIYRTTVLGAFASAGEDDSIAIGYNSRSDNVNSIAIGTNATATFTNSITLGNNASAKANNTVVIGNDDTVAQIPNIDAVTTLGNISYRYADVISNQVSVNAPLTSPALIELAADAGSSNDDVWTIGAADGGDFSISSFATGVDVNLLTITNTGDAVLSGDLTLNSDERLKKNIKSIKGALDLIGGIDGKTYQWKASEKSQAMQYGLIAQQLESVLPQLVKDKEDGMKTVNYQGLIPVLVNAVNELSAQKQKQDNRIASLEDRLERQNSLIEALMEKLD
jgi:autotransporter adhesin